MTEHDNDCFETWPADLRAGEVHVWACSGLLETPLRTVAGILAEEERGRIGGMRFEKDRRRLAGSRYFLRRVLARYLDCAPSELAFTSNARGKPVVEGAGLEFNLSRSHDVALVGVRGDGELGVDVEWCDPRRVDDAVVGRQFSEAEQRFVHEAADPGRAFFEIWTRKEAYIKALGTGLSHPLGQFSVVPRPGGGACDVEDRSAHRPVLPFRVRSIELPDPGYLAAVAAASAWESIDLVPVRLVELLDGHGGAGSCSSS